MSDASAPPARIEQLESKPLSADKTQERIHTFLAEFRNRSVAGGGDGAVVAQLEKLSAALAEDS